MDSTRHRTCTLNWLFFHCWRKNCQNCKWLKYFMIYLFLWFSESYCMNKFILPLFIWKPCNWRVQNKDQPTESLARQNINGHLGHLLTCRYKSVNQSPLWCYHSNEISSVVLSEGAICFTAFYKMKFGHSW